MAKDKVAFEVSVWMILLLALMIRQVTYCVFCSGELSNAGTLQDGLVGQWWKGYPACAVYLRFLFNLCRTKDAA